LERGFGLRKPSESALSHQTALLLSPDRVSSAFSSVGRASTDIGAFSWCTPLADVDLPSVALSEGRIGLDAFDMCQQLVGDTDADHWRRTDGSKLKTDDINIVQTTLVPRS